MGSARAIIHLDHFMENFRIIQKIVGQEKRICVPVKADAYGHGAKEIARASLKAGAFCFAVADLQEGALLRNDGITAPILLFSQALPYEIPEIIKNKLTPLVSDIEFIQMLDDAASTANTRLPVHLKIDTGMGRLGCTPAQAVELARKISSSNGLEYAGTLTHFACADSSVQSDIEYTERQIACFDKVVKEIQAAGIDTGIVHAANSGAVILHPKARYNMIRPGILLYGYNFSGVKPVMELRANIVHLKQVKKGDHISYGRTWTAEKDTTIGVLQIGYADGLPRLAGNKWQVYIKGNLYPIAGRICMDQCMVDLGSISRVCRWDEAVIFGGPAPDAGELASLTGTIPYEITCNINKRVTREYLSQPVSP